MNEDTNSYLTSIGRADQIPRSRSEIRMENLRNSLRMRDTFSNVTSMSLRMASLERKVDALIKMSADPNNAAFKNKLINVDEYNISAVS